MSHVALRFDVDAADADRWSDALLDAGALSVEAADPRAGTRDETAVFAEAEVAEPQWWPVTRLTALCDERSDARAIVLGAASAIARAAPAFETFFVPEQDWVRATQAQFGPIRVDETLWVVPSWCAAPRPDAVNIILDPGIAFGTGAHPTTRLCLRWLVSHVRACASVLDYGCGSGILAIAAARLGAGRVVGVDIDAQAVRASADNARANDVRAQFSLADSLGPGRFDLVVANILANPLRMLAQALVDRVRTGGSIALCGILDAQVPDVVTAYARWIALSAWRREDGWVLLAGARTPSD